MGHVHMQHGLLQSAMSPHQVLGSKRFGHEFEALLLGACSLHLLRATGSCSGKGFGPQPAHSLIQSRAVATVVPDDSVMVQFMQRKNPREETSSCKYPLHAG